MGEDHLRLVPLHIGGFLGYDSNGCTHQRVNRIESGCSLANRCGTLLLG
jgi:hypothetical protein